MFDDLIALLGTPISRAKSAAQLMGAEHEYLIENKLGRFNHSVLDLGIEFQAQLDRRVSAIFLYGVGHSSYKPYRGNLPASLGFESSQAAVRKTLGEPTTTGGGGKSILYEKVPCFDIYTYPTHVIQFRYTSDLKKIDRVTLMRPDAVP